VREGLWLAAAGGVTAMMDLSDGVGIDLPRLAAENHAGAVIDVDRLPVDDDTRAVAAALGVDPLAWATGGGEDYELLLACEPTALARLQRGLAEASGIHLTPIGEVTAERGVRWRSGGREVTVARGFEHFAPDGGQRSGRVIDSIVLQLLSLSRWSSARRCSPAPRPRTSRLAGPGSADDRPADRDGGSPPLIERPHDLLVTLVVGITVINIGGAAVAAHLADQLVGSRFGLVLEMLAMVVVLTTFGEVLPMTLAVKYPEQFLAIVGRPVAWLGKALTPVRAALGSLTALTVQLVGRQSTLQPELTEEELRTLVDVGASEGVVEREEREMIHKVFELEDTLVRSVMVPRTDMFCLDIETPREEILPALRENLHSRCRCSRARSTSSSASSTRRTSCPTSPPGCRPTSTCARTCIRPYFVPSPSAPTRCCRSSRPRSCTWPSWWTSTAAPPAWCAGGPARELVGEIADEYDEPERLIQRLDASTFRVSGKLPPRS
jgi:putative hemolysin